MRKLIATPFIFALLMGVMPAAAQQPRPAPAVRLDPAAQAERSSRVEKDKLTLSFPRGGKLSISNSAGPIVITGVEGETLEAKAAAEASSDPAGIRVYQDPTKPAVGLSVVSLEGRRYSGDALLDIKVPRYATVELDAFRDEVKITGIEGAVAIGSGRGTVTVTRVGSLHVSRFMGELIAKEIKGVLSARTSHGDMTIENVAGPIDVATSHGDIQVQNAGGDVRASAGAGDISLRCAKGRADITTASGDVTLVGIGGDLDVSTAAGSVTFEAEIRAEGRYRMRSMTGDVVMTIQSEPPGFTATLLSYSGEIETAFPLKVSGPLAGGPVNRRMTGVYGDGQARLTLDSFSGAVRLVKSPSRPAAQCK
jgi:hypothetical protein